MKKNIFDYLSNAIDVIGSAILFGGLAILAIVLIPTVIIYFIMSATQGQLTDKVSTVFNLIAGLFLVIMFVIKVFAGSFGNKEEHKKSIIFPILFIIILVILFFIGLNRNIPSLLFPFVYKGIYSGLAALTYPSIIYYIIYLLITSDEKWSKIKDSLLIVIGAFVFMFAMSMLGSFYFSFTHKEDVFNNVVEYKNLAYQGDRKDIDDVDSFIIETLSNSAKNTVEHLKKANAYQILVNDGANKKELEERLKTLLHNNYYYSNNSLSDKGYKIVEYKWIDDFTILYKIVDQETNKDYFYYKVSYKTFETINSTKEEFDSIDKK